MRSPNYKLWTAISLGLLAACCAISIAADNDVRLISLLIVPPLLAGLGTTPIRTGVISTLSLTAAILLGLQEGGHFLSTSHGLRISVVALACALAVQTSILRERDLRTRRRLLLINASRDHLAAASGVEAALTSFCKAAVTAEFALWAVLDLRLPGGETVRIVETGEPASRLDVGVQAKSSSVTASYEAEVERGGPLLLRDAPQDLIDGLFDGEGRPALKRVNVMVLGTTVGDLKANYFLVCPDPHPRWGQAEVTQVGSLARQAAQRARADQLFDRITHAQQELQESRDEVSAIIGGIASGIIAQRSDGEIVYANDIAASLLDFQSGEAMIGANFEDVLARIVIRREDGTPFDSNQAPSRRALRGEQHPMELLRYIVKSTGEEFWIFVRSTAIFAASGEPTLAIAVIEDNTDRKRHELAQAFLADASAKLAEPLGFDETVRALADAAVPAIADWCTIELVGPRGVLETIAVAHRDPAMVEAVKAYRSEYPITADDDFGPALAIRNAEAVLYDEIDEDRARSIYGDEERAEALSTISSRSSLSAPIVAQGKAIGSIMLALSRPGARFTEYDVDTVTELGRRAGISLDNARLHTERMRMLASLQKSLVPAELPKLEGLSLSATFRPAERDAEVGGDFYDAFALADGSSAVVIGDVCGKGPEAAALTALARYTIRTAAMHESDPERILRLLNEALIDQVTDGRFCTVAFARFQPSSGGGLSVEAISAGHPLPLVINGGPPRAIGKPGTLLGVVGDPDLPVVRATLGPGEAMALYTDGLSAGQTTDDTSYALELVGSIAFSSGEGLAQQIDRAAIDRQDEPNRDDVAIIVAAPD